MALLPSDSQLATVRNLTGPLAGKTIAFLATDGFEQMELLGPRDLLEQAGSRTIVVSPKSGHIQGFVHLDKGDEVPVDMMLEQANARQFDALVLPGGVSNPDALRTDDKAIAFVRGFASEKKPIAAICHAPWTLINAGLVKGRTVTSWPSIKLDLQNAGAMWIDEPVVVDGGLITSRKPDDVPAFTAKLIESLTEQ